ncbi:MAG TPA: hypothetical protein VG870_05075 [Chitinophagaceae bacterium]|nr:hypothetical protein [Chitinophagaceae bacterium]
MRKATFFVAILVALAGGVKAQSRSTNSSTYETALGVKVWDGGGISLKHFFNSNNAGELIAYFWSHGIRFTGLYEIHGPISGAEGLRWYIGPGAHLGSYSSKYGDGAFVGIDGVLGLDYKFRGAPINMSLDWQPSFEFGTDRGFYSGWGGLGIRYTF